LPISGKPEIGAPCLSMGLRYPHRWEFVHAKKLGFK